MKNKIVVSSFLAAAVALTAVAVVAKETGSEGSHRPGMRIDFAAADLNGDGNLTAEEIQAHHLARFKAADTDGNGILSQDELIQQARAGFEDKLAKRTARMIEKRDTNGDGGLSADEMAPSQAMTDRIFERMDADQDGLISQEEIAAAQEHWAQKRDHKRN